MNYPYMQIEIVAEGGGWFNLVAGSILQIEPHILNN